MIRASNRKGAWPGSGRGQGVSLMKATSRLALPRSGCLFEVRIAHTPRGPSWGAVSAGWWWVRGRELGQFEIEMVLRTSKALEYRVHGLTAGQPLCT